MLMQHKNNPFEDSYTTQFNIYVEADTTLKTEGLVEPLL